MKSYISLWIDYGGLISFWFDCLNSVYGCVF